MDHYPQPRPILYGTSGEQTPPQTQTGPVRTGPPRFPPAPPAAGDAPDPFDRPPGRLEVGQAVRITDGPFADFEGIVDKVDKEMRKVRVRVSMFGREFPNDIDLSQVEKM